jgi:23S rRNA (pseudouridine1915-N3)-methyltransferase
MAVYVIAVGRIKSTFLREACETYQERTGRYTKLHVREVRDAGRSDRNAAQARDIEGDAVLKALPSGVHLVALTRAGRMASSNALAESLATWQQTRGAVAFVIGGAHGLHERVLDRADSLLSLSEFTLPHELARLVLLEQLYRAHTILRGEPYHKGG